MIFKALSVLIFHKSMKQNLSPASQKCMTLRIHVTLTLLICKTMKSSLNEYLCCVSWFAHILIPHPSLQEGYHQYPHSVAEPAEAQKAEQQTSLSQ